ncbi:E3 ubiquitin-protein ligase LIN [Spatholobus suberectus]|nr:E3 ubiquitin-protein ligase LIN [Spatholobus suberectus]
MTTVTVTTRSQILRHTAAFTSSVLSQSELRRCLIATLLRDAPISDRKHLNLAANTLESAISVSSPAVRSSSLSLAEKLLLPLPEFPVSSFLLSLIDALRNRPTESATSLLRIFSHASSASLARSKSPPRSTSASSLSTSSPFSAGSTSRGRGSSPPLRAATRTVAIARLPRSTPWCCLPRRVLAVYFKEVLVSENGRAAIRPPSLVLKSAGESNGRENRKEEMMQMDVLENGRCNPIWSEREASIEFLSRSSSSRSSHAPFYPQRVFSGILKPQKPSKTWTTPVYLKSTAETDFYLDEDSLSSSSDSEAENEAKDKTIALLEPRQSQIHEQC